WPILLLTWVGGSVDAICFLALYHMFVAHMSGNSASLGAFLGQGQWKFSLLHFFPIPLFIFGIVVGRIIYEHSTRSGFRYSLALILGLEVTLLSLFMIFGNKMSQEGLLDPDSALGFYLLASLPVMSMGLQNSTIRSIGSFSLHTTYITGVLNSLAEEGVKYLYWVYDSTRGNPMKSLTEIIRVSPRNDSFMKTLLSFNVWVAYIFGAVLGSFAKNWWSLSSLALPICVLMFLIIFYLIKPSNITASDETT
ncbi:MAG: YoaK family protein, partial [Thermodesulfobacteriota bacterium]